MLVGAAADRWNVDASECDAAGGAVVRGGERLTFGELAEEAAERRPATPMLRPHQARQLAGKPLQRLDAPAKANGSLRFPGDVRLPGMLFAAVRMAPPGGRLSGYARDRIKSQPGIRRLVARDGWIAIVADNWWAAEQAMKAAAPRFTGNETPPDLRPLFEAAIGSQDSEERFSSGNYDEVTENSRALAATYFVAPAQHLGLEPVSATARFRGGALELWSASQAPGFAEALAASAGGLSAADVIFYPVPVGDPGGRALEADLAPIAVELARTLGQPVQATLSQHGAQNHDRASAGALMRMTALPGPMAIPEAWQMRIATDDGLASALARLAGEEPPGKLGRTALDGAVPPYAIANVRVQAVRCGLPVITGYMRGSPQRELCFATECFVDELARAAGMEPLAFRMSMLGSQPRLARCLQAAAQAAQWDGGRPGSTMGIAGCSAFGSHIGLVAIASLEQGRVKAHKLIAAVDCGRVINAGLVRQQIEGGLIWALAQATVASPEWLAGMPRARAIGGIALPRIGDSPEIVTHIIPSNDQPGGVSGLGTTVLAPAIANALFSGSGRRLRSLPFDLAAAA
jgi:isoquinoline 1-oxidoreductase beta subunit